MSQLAVRVSAEVTEAAARLVHVGDLYGLSNPEELVIRAGQVASERGWAALRAIAYVRAELDEWWLKVSTK